jgi:para-aminobenzoate synthetase component 1
MEILESAFESIDKMNLFGQKQIPFLFIVDYEMRNSCVLPLNEIKDIDFKFPGFDKMLPVNYLNGKFQPSDFKETPVKINNNLSKPIINHKGYDYDKYKSQFDEVVSQIKNGNSYLVNLTCRTPVETDYDIKALYDMSEARYKIRYNDKFICFTPETFVRINNGLITSCPMKGTIDANIPFAAQKILDDKKEKAEHSTIVDLIRNDLSIVATDVKVENFRYIEEIETENGKLLQVSSSITGNLPLNYRSEIGNIIFSLLPAGSVTGAPKPKTLDIIRNAETYCRGFYTGIFGIFDGENLDSAVMIRFLEKTPQGWVYKSGGGITALSNPVDEYEEMLKKIYVPVHREH